MILLFASSVIGRYRRGNDPKDNKKATHAKSEYESSSDKGLGRVRRVIRDEREFGALLVWISDAKIGLRRGTEANNAAYALSDLGFSDFKDAVKMAFWKLSPYTMSSEKTNEWYEHLYNSIMEILDLEQSSSAPLFLLTGATSDDGERYFIDKVGIGDGQTFMKVNITAPDVPKVGESLNLDLSTSFFDVSSTVDKVLQWIYDTFKDLQ